MEPFDRDYLERREKQIHELYNLRYMTGAVFVTGLILTLVSLGLIVAGYGVGGAIMLVMGLLFDVGALFMVASYFAERAADRAIQRERDQLFALYGQKPKRGSSDGEIPLADDGELAEPLEEDDLIHREGRSRSG
jgi:hypothetical protein